MKKQIFETGGLFLCLSLSLTAWGASQGVREIRFKTEKVGEVVHWMPEKVSVKPGEKVKLVLEHSLEGGFNLHGFTIAALKIAKQVDRNKLTEFEVTIPETLRPGPYPITCQFHPKHAGARLIVGK